MKVIVDREALRRRANRAQIASLGDFAITILVILG